MHCSTLQDGTMRSPYCLETPLGPLAAPWLAPPDLPLDTPWTLQGAPVSPLVSQFASLL